MKKLLLLMIIGSAQSYVGAAGIVPDLDDLVYGDDLDDVEVPDLLQARFLVRNDLEGAYADLDLFLDQRENTHRILIALQQEIDEISQSILLTEIEEGFGDGLDNYLMTCEEYIRKHNFLIQLEALISRLAQQITELEEEEL